MFQQCSIFSFFAYSLSSKEENTNLFMSISQTSSIKNNNAIKQILKVPKFEQTFGNNRPPKFDRLHEIWY